MSWKSAGMIVGMLFFAAQAANGQAAAPVAPADAPVEKPWAVEVAFGLDNSISGNINSSAVGRLNNLAVVVTSNQYEDVYGSGLHLKFGGGYMIKRDLEIRGMFTLQSLDAELVRMGDIGVSPLYGQFADYQSFGFDVGLRQYGTISPRVRPYYEGLIGIAVVDETNVVLVAPAYNVGSNATDFYDKTAAFTFGANAGVLIQTGKQLSVYGQMGLRRVGGMSEVDDLEGTGLETINDESARWTFPVLVGIRFRF